MNESLKRWAELEAEKRVLEDQLKTITDEQGRLHDNALEGLLSDGIDQIRLRGLTVYVREQLWAGVDTQPGEDVNTAHERAARALHKVGWTETAALRVNLQRLSAIVRELRDQGEELPEQLRPHIRVTPKIELRARLR